jgi:hypothetical protein
MNASWMVLKTTEAAQGFRGFESLSSAKSPGNSLICALLRDRPKRVMP